MAIDESWGRALRTAKRRYEERHDTDLTYKGMGVRLGELLGRDPLPHPTVRSWFVDGQEPDTFAVVRALATMLEVSVGELLSAGDSRPAEDPSSRQPVAPHKVAEPQPPIVKHPIVTDVEGGASVPVDRTTRSAGKQAGKKQRPA